MVTTNNYSCIYISTTIIAVVVSIERWFLFRFHIVTRYCRTDHLFLPIWFLSSASSAVSFFHFVNRTTSFLFVDPRITMFLIVLASLIFIQYSKRGRGEMQRRNACFTLAALARWFAYFLYCLPQLHPAPVSHFFTCTFKFSVPTISLQRVHHRRKSKRGWYGVSRWRHRFTGNVFKRQKALI